MPSPWEIAASSGGAAVVTLAGVAVGAVLTYRAQKRHWLRDKQIEACIAVTAEATRTEHALRREWKHGERPDWVGWNQVLAAIWLVGVPAVVEAAQNIDGAFWRESARIRSGKVADEEAWLELRNVLKTVQLDFINAARIHVVGTGSPLRAFPGQPPDSG